MIRDGLFFWNGQHGVLVDYLFDNLVTAWSNMPESTYQIKQHLTKFLKTASGPFLKIIIIPEPMSRNL